MKMFKVFYHKYDSSRKWAAYDNLKTRQEERKRQLTFKIEYIRKDDDFKKDKLLNTRCSYLDIEVNMRQTRLIGLDNKMKNFECLIRNEDQPQLQLENQASSKLHG